METTCMVIGLRKVDPDKLDYVREELRQKVLLAIHDGYTHFISGFVQGTDLWFAKIVLELRKTYPISLEAALPNKNFVLAKHFKAHRLLAQCNIVGVYSKEQDRSCFIQRNRLMVEFSGRVIAVYDGCTKSNVYAVLQYAHILGREIHLIDV